MLNKEIPFLRIGLPLCIGIVSGLYFKPEILFLVVSSCIIVAGFCLSLFFNRNQTNFVYGISFTCAMIVLGILLHINEKNRLSVLEPEPAKLICTLSDYPEEKEKSFRFIVKLNHKINNNAAIPLQGSLLIYGNKDSSIANLIPGDQVVINCSPVNISNRGNPDEFDYRFYMENRGIKYYAFINKGDLIMHEASANRRLIHRALIIRKKITEMYQRRGIIDGRLALVAAITLGQKKLLDPEQKENFIKAGVMHIMAVSGLHAMILSMFVYNLLFFLKKRFQVLRILITILFLWAFAFVTGLTPSVLRATLMFSFLQSGNLMKRRVSHVNSVLASAFVLILIRPSVIFEAGFLLSYSAVIFIICFYQDLYLKLQLEKWLPDKIWQAAVITLVAQAGTLPLTITLFNRFPVYFIMTNILIVPLSSLVILSGCLVLMTYPVHFISRFFASLLSYFTGITERLTENVSAFPFSTLENIGMTNIECILLSCTIFLFTWFLLKKHSFSIKYPLAFLMLFVLAGTIKKIDNRISNEVIVYNSINASSIGIRTGRILILYSDSDTITPEVLKHCATRGLKLQKNITGDRLHILRVDNKNILICNYLNNNLLKKAKPDLIILYGRYPQVLKGIDFAGPVEGLIMTSEVASGYQLPLNISSEKPDTIHFVRRSGAFRVRL